MLMVPLVETVVKWWSQMILVVCDHYFGWLATNQRFVTNELDKM
jgi:hypothetical protein